MTTGDTSASSCTRISDTDTPYAAAPAAVSRVAWLRWVFLVLTFAVTMVGYADRQVLGLLKPVLDQRFGWTGADYGAMTTAFQVAIAAALLGAGWFMDRDVPP